MYTFRNPLNDSRTVTFQLHFPSKHAIYDGLTIELNGKQMPFTASRDGASISTVLAAGQTAMFRATYRSQGLDSWRYNLGDDVTQHAIFN